MRVVSIDSAASSAGKIVGIHSGKENSACLHHCPVQRGNQAERILSYQAYPSIPTSGRLSQACTVIMRSIIDHKQLPVGKCLALDA